MKEKPKKTIKIIFYIFISITIIFSVFWSTYSFFMKNSYTKYEQETKSIVENIIFINNGVDFLNKDQILDTNLAKKELPSSIDSLVKVKQNLAQVVPSEKYRKTHEHLLSGLENNILMYKQILGILNSPQSNDIEKSVLNLKKYKEDCMNAYSLFNVKNLHIVLSEKNLTFIDNVISYSYDAIRIKSDAAIKKSQNLEFVNTLDSLSTNFIAIRMDFNIELQTVRKGTMSYDALLSLVEKNKEDFFNIKNSFSKVTVPPQAISACNYFNKALEQYDLYLQDFRYSINSEKIESLNKKSNKNGIVSLYSDANEKLSNVIKNYDKFIKLYTDYKASL